MYNAQQEALRQGVWNYIGTIISSCDINMSAKDKKQLAIALISEELAKACKTDDNTIDMYVAKPILKSTEWILSNRIEEASKRIDSVCGTLDKELILKERKELRDKLLKAIDQIK